MHFQATPWEGLDSSLRALELRLFWIMHSKMGDPNALHLTALKVIQYPICHNAHFTLLQGHTGRGREILEAVEFGV